VANRYLLIVRKFRNDSCTLLYNFGRGKRPVRV